MYSLIITRVATASVLPLVALSGVGGYSYYNRPVTPYQNPNQYQNTGGQLSVSGLDAPQSLTVGQSGTWSVHATVAGGYQTGGQIYYSVVWGDETHYASQAASAQYPSRIAQSSGTFTHVYTTAGTYTPVFSITDQYGHSVQARATTVVYGTTNTYCPRGQVYQNGYCQYYPGTGSPNPYTPTNTPCYYSNGYAYGNCGNNGYVPPPSTTDYYYNRTAGPNNPYVAPTTQPDYSCYYDRNCLAGLNAGSYNNTYNNGYTGGYGSGNSYEGSYYQRSY